MAKTKRAAKKKAAVKSVTIRLPLSLVARLVEAAEGNVRSLNGEIRSRLEWSLG